MLRDALRPWVSKGRLLRDRVLHPLRRLRAWHQLRAAPPSSVIFLCNGNICRSPYAEHAFRKRIAEPFASSLRVSSMGLLWPGHPAPPVAQACAAAHGVDLGEHLSAAFEYRGGAPGELLVVMTVQQRREIWHRSRAERRVLLLGDLDPVTGETRDIADPVDQPYEAFDACYTRIDRCVAELTRALSVGEEVGRPARSRR